MRACRVSSIPMVLDAGECDVLNPEGHKHCVHNFLRSQHVVSEFSPDDPFGR